jgi:acyl-homoserine lactone acylase PvdQ
MPSLDAGAPTDALPPMKGELRLPSHFAPVEVLRNAYVIPHLRAGMAADAWSPPGFVDAQDNSPWALFHGVSGQPGGPHYTDQHVEWAGSWMVPMLYGCAPIRTAARSVQVLRP